MIPFGPIEIDPLALGSQGNAVLGIRDSGKTYTATELAEGLFEAGIPFTAFDPIGVWRFLRVPGAGRGYPVVVAGGQDGDLPLTPASAPAIVEAAMVNGVSLVIDLFDINLSKADWKRIVASSLEVMLHRIHRARPAPRLHRGGGGIRATTARARRRLRLRGRGEAGAHGRQLAPRLHPDQPAVRGSLQGGAGALRQPVPSPAEGS